ncbi:MAG: Gfo/Idh/MocA family oxidoreductase, partial [Bacteroidota bacterium]
MNILIIGAGMYVTGRNNSGTGTVLASIAQLSKEMSLGKVIVASKSASSKQGVDEAATRINALLGTNISVDFKALGNEVQKVLADIHRDVKIDSCIIAVPDHLHYEMAVTVMELGIHCLIVKPLTPTLAEAQDLLRIQHKHKVYAAVEFHKRWDETNLYIKK